MKQILKLLFFYEKPRYYHGGAWRFPQRITQKFWDEMQERKKYYDDWNNNNPTWPKTDTSTGSQAANLGERPLTPDWILKVRANIINASGIIGWSLILGYLFYYFFLR